MIYRVQHNKDNPYFMLNRTAVEDDALSFRAVGILTYLLSKPDNWTVQEADLSNRHTDGTAAVRTGLAELKAAGYLRKSPIRDEDTGRITGWETHVFEIPENAIIHNVENPHCGKPTDWKIAHIVINESLESNEGSKHKPPPTAVGPSHTSKETTKTPPPVPLRPPLIDGLTAGELATRRGKSLKYCQDYDWKIHRATFEATVDAMGKRALVDADNDRTIGELQQAAVTLTKAGVSAETIVKRTGEWQASFFGKNNGSASQFIDFMGTSPVKQNGNGASMSRKVQVLG